MYKKILSFVLCILCAFTLFTACGKNEKDKSIVELPIAEPNANITKPEGKFFETNGKLAAEGGLSVLGDNFLKIMIEGKEYEFGLSDDAVRKIGIFNKDKENLKIKRGTILMLFYEIKDGTYFATDIEIITAN